MINKEKVIRGLKHCSDPMLCNDACPYYRIGKMVSECTSCLARDALELLKEQENEYEKGFNDTMLGKQELMYEGVDGRWHKKDW